MIRFQHKLRLLQNVFLFFSKLARGLEQFSWLVKKEHLFQKNVFFSKGLDSLKSTLCRPLPIQISTFSEICREVLLKNRSSLLLSTTEYCVKTLTLSLGTHTSIWRWMNVRSDVQFTCFYGSERNSIYVIKRSLNVQLTSIWRSMIRSVNVIRTSKPNFKSTLHGR